MCISELGAEIVPSMLQTENNVISVLRMVPYDRHVVQLVQRLLIQHLILPAWLEILLQIVIRILMRLKQPVL